MRRVLSLLVALGLAATGCSVSSVDPDAPVRISGRALDASGKPLAQAPVLLVKQADIGEVVFGTVLVVGSLSTFCLLPDPPAICAKARTATTDADGRYEFALTGADTQGTLGTESTMNVVFSGSTGTTTGSTTVSFTVEETTIRLPDARLWNARPRVSPGPGKIRVAWAPLPAGDASYATQLYEADGRSPLWSQPASGRRAVIDARILEDRSGSVAVSAGAELPGAIGAGKVRTSHLSPRLRAGTGAGTPPSRGRRCAPVTGTAPAVDGRQGRCAATDGDLDAPARLSGSGVVTGVVVDLGSVRAVDLVVARGFAGQFLVELSDDGKDYRTVATASGTAAAVEPRGGQRARYVRLRSPAGVDQSLSAEVSVW